MTLLASKNCTLASQSTSTNFQKPAATIRHAVFVAAVLLGLNCLAFSATVAVGSCTNLASYPTIGQAVSSVPAGSTIEICPGTYPEQVVITKKLTLKGVSNASGADNPVIVPPTGGLVQNGTDIFGNAVAAQIFVASPTGPVTIEHLTVDGTGNQVIGCGAATLEGIYFQNTSGVITYNAVRNHFQTDYADFGGCQNGLAINVESISSSNTVTISFNSVHAYQKNGITATGAGAGAGSPGPDVTINGNYIVGLGATAMNWQGVYLGHGTAAENGVQVGFGASGKVSNNAVTDNIWGQDTNTDPGDAASGILVFSSDGITVSGNEVGSAQFGIAIETDGAGFCGTVSSPISCGPSDNAVVTGNKVFGTQIFDAIDACSNGNTIMTNTLQGNTESGVHFDSSCTNGTLGTVSGNNNTATGNTINEACAGILDSGTGNHSAPNTFFNVGSMTLMGNVCPAGMSATKSSPPSTKQRSLRPSPYRSGRR